MASQEKTTIVQCVTTMLNANHKFMVRRHIIPTTSEGFYKLNMGKALSQPS